MADRNPEQDNLFKEIDEELRQEHYAKLWKKYGNVVIGAVVVLVLSVASYQGWKSYNLNQRTESSQLFNSAIKKIAANKPDEAAGLLAKLSFGGSAGYAVLSRFNQAAVLVKKNDTEGASSAYQKMSQDSSVPLAFRNLALLMSVMHGLDHGDPAQLSASLAGLMAAGNPWRHSAKELTALAAQKAGDKSKAGKLYKELADDATAPSGIRTRAAEMSAILGG